MLIPTGEVGAQHQLLVTYKTPEEIEHPVVMDMNVKPQGRKGLFKGALMAQMIGHPATFCAGPVQAANEG